MKKIIGQILIINVFLFNGCANSNMKRYPISDHFNGDEFYSNPKIEALSTAQIIGHIIGGRNGSWPDKTIQPQVFKPDSSQNCINVTLVGHATTLIQINGFNILTDPVWSDRVGPSSFFGPKRISQPGIEFEKLPHIDLVLISHDHYDHLDLPTINLLEKKYNPIFVVPLGVENTIEALKLKHVQTLDWWDKFIFKDFEIHLTPAQHNSGRGIFDKNKTLWGGYVILGGSKKVYFAGDTGWGDHFEKIYERFGAMNVALLPIGGYKPEHKMSRFHISPSEAVKASQIIRAGLSIPIHYDTFQLTAEDYQEPLKDLSKALLESSDSRASFHVLKPGESTCHRF